MCTVAIGKNVIRMTTSIGMVEILVQWRTHGLVNSEGGVQAYYILTTALRKDSPPQFLSEESHLKN